MATIKSQMTLNDGMSAVLKKITNALDTTLTVFEQMQSASGQAFDTDLIQHAHLQIAEANNGIREMEREFKRAAGEEARLNDGIRQGTSAADGMLRKVASLAGAYASISGIKRAAEDAMGAADIQINAQRQLRTVLNNMGAEEEYAAFQDEIAMNPLETSLALDTAGAADSYDAFLSETGQVTAAVQLDAPGVSSAYEDILAKASEIQGKGIYGDEAMIAGAAEFATYFSDAEAIMSMMDTLSNYAMGMSGGGEVDSKAMADYATGIGKLMTGSYGAMTKKGFAFSDAQKAIIEGTATEAQIVAELGEEYLNCSSDMQAAAAIGAVISESWDGLYEAMSSTPEGKLIQLNNTLGDIKENVGAGIYPAVVDFVNMIQGNLPQIETAAMGFASVLGVIIGLLGSLAGGALAFGSAAADNWSWIEPIVWGLVAALIAYNAVQGIGWLAAIQSVAAKAAHAAASAAETAALLALTAAQEGLNAAMALCPTTWIVIGILALIAAVVSLVRCFDVFGAKSATVFGTLFGLLNIGAEGFRNLLMAVADVGLGIINVIAAVCGNMKTAFHNAISKVQSWFYGLLSTALTVISGICEALNKLPFVEFDYSGISGKAEEYAAKSAEAAADTGEYAGVAGAFRQGFSTLDAFADGWASEAFQSGAAWGDSAMDKLGGVFNYELGTINDYANNGMGVGPDPFMMDGLAGDVSDIAGNTGAAAKSLEISGEELKYLRDIAERDAVNRFTTAEVKIDFSGMTNRIDSGMDLDGVIRTLTDGFAEALVTAAEGVHP